MSSARPSSSSPSSASLGDFFAPGRVPTATFPYRIEEQVGSGAMGVVYRAIDSTLERPVAIKVLRRSLLEEAPEDERTQMRLRFLQEARAAAALAHPGITTVYQVGEEGGQPYLVMEWLDGQTLENLIRQRGRLEVSEAVGLIVSLLETLDAAHRGGVIHRDIKPANLVLLQDGRLKVTDFGIARLQGREVVKTQAGVVLATPRFASPEQLRGETVDGRSDLFAVGILLYFLATGRFPFEGANFVEVATSIFEKTPRAPRELIAEMHPAVEAVILKALRKPPEQRFQSATEMATALRPFAGETPEVARVASVPPPSAGDSAQTTVIEKAAGDPRRAVIQLVRGWPNQTLPRQPTAMLIDRLLEKPIHAPAFAGAVMLDHFALFLYEGLLLAAVDLNTGESGDAVTERLPLHCDCDPHLFPVPQRLGSGIMPLLTTVFQPPKYRHRDLDSTFVNLPALADSLRSEKFDGIVRLMRGEAFGLIFFAAGENVLNIFSDGWDAVPVDQSWSQWMPRFKVRAHVEEQVEAPLHEGYRRALRNFALTIDLEGDVPTGWGTMSSLGMTRPPTESLPRFEVVLSPSQSGGTGRYPDAKPYRFLAWALRELPAYMAERKKAGSFKYLVEWLPKVERARLYHDLPRPNAKENDAFDLVTFDSDGKVLHLGERYASASREHVEAFVERVIAAKNARTQTGDVGGAFLIAKHFDEDALAAYADVIHTASSGNWLNKLEESFTGYEGFVRVGPRRGFHLLLIEEKDEEFVPLLS